MAPPLARRALLTCVVIVFAAGCGGPPTASSATPGAPGRPSDDAASGPPFRGFVSRSSGALQVVACGAPGTAVRTVAGPASSEIGDAVDSLASKGITSAYVEMRGQLSADGRSVDASGDILLSKDKSECPVVFDGDYVAGGNDPFWSIEVHPATIVFRSREEPKGRSFPYSATPSETGSPEYATRVDRPRVSTLRLAVRRGRCVDSISGEIRPFTAHAEIDGKPLSGCAFAGVPAGGFGDDPLDALERYAGTYPARSKLWSAEPLASRLSRVLGSKRGAFEAAMQASGPLMKDAAVYYVLGTKGPRAGTDVAVFLADPGADTIEVILFEGGKRSEFRDGDRDVVPPAEARTLLDTLPPS